jgi:hypothetical protein
MFSLNSLTKINYAFTQKTDSGAGYAMPKVAMVLTPLCAKSGHSNAYKNQTIGKINIFRC